MSARFYYGEILIWIRHIKIRSSLAPPQAESRFAVPVHAGRTARPPLRFRLGQPMRAVQARDGKVRSATDSTLLSLGKCRQGWPKGKIDAGRIPANRGGIPPDPDRSGGPGTEALAPGLTQSVRGRLLPGVRLHPAGSVSEPIRGLYACRSAVHLRARILLARS